MADFITVQSVGTVIVIILIVMFLAQTRQDRNRPLF